VDTTRRTLLVRLKDPGDEHAWPEFVSLYRPILVRYARARGLPITEAEDIAQQCLVAVVRRIASFEYDRQRGGFKRWLRTLVNNRVRNLWRDRREVHAASADLRRPQTCERSPEEDWDRIWLQEHLNRCLQQVEQEVETKTYLAFRYSALEQWPVERICAELGVTRDQVYVSKSRVTRRLRELMKDMLGEDGAVEHA
jgi:RNA polymerase sigma factor (sigma-70 family)